MILQIHDELLFEGPPEEMEQATEIVTREMVGAAEHGPAADGRRRRRRQLAQRQMSRDTALVVALVIGARRRRAGAAELAARAATSAACRRRRSRSASSLPLRCSSLTLIAGQAGGFADVGKAPLHVLIGGGLVGALYVGSIVWTVRALGVTGLSAVTLAGQFAAALAIDHFGWLGVDRSPITLAKLAGVAPAGRGDVPDRRPTNLHARRPTRRPER